MEHVEIAKRGTGRADIEQRLTGRFYTPLFIADRIAEQVLALCGDPISVGDPFCGDGRLVLAWLRAASRHSSFRRLRRIVLWDYDADAVRLARERVNAELSVLGLVRVVDVEAEAGDTFARAHALGGSLDTVLTNPPWDLLKPDARDRVDLDTGFKRQLRSYAATLARNYPGAMSASGKAMTGYGVNLARAGAIVSALAVRRGGAVAIVLPSSIFADQASAPFRTEFFTRLCVQHLDRYPAEARLFDGVDQPFVTAAAVPQGSTREFVLRRFDKGLELLDERSVEVGTDPAKPVALDVSGEHYDLARTIGGQHVPISMLEADMRFGLWLGRELDETRLALSLGGAGDGVPFLKGRHVFPYTVHRDEALYVDPAKRSIPKTVKEHRLAWRDVSRPTQKRRMHVAIVPEGNVTGNSLGVAFFRYGRVERIQIMVALMNSMAFELQVRSHLATAHVSQGVLRKCTVPARCFEDDALFERLLELVRSRTLSGRDEPQLETVVAQAYDLSRDSFSLLLQAFPKLTPSERTAYLRSWS